MSELRRLFQIAMDAEEYCSTHGLDVESEARRITGERDALFSAAAFEQMRGQMALDTDDDDDDVNARNWSLSGPFDLDLAEEISQVRLGARRDER